MDHLGRAEQREMSSSFNIKSKEFSFMRLGRKGHLSGKRVSIAFLTVIFWPFASFFVGIMARTVSRGDFLSVMSSPLRCGE